MPVVLVAFCEHDGFWYGNQFLLMNKQKHSLMLGTMRHHTGTKKAKARIVLLGFEHPNLLDRNFKTSAPVISTLGRRFIYMVSTFYQWRLTGLDLASAFLQTTPTEADARLWTYGAPELREALKISDNSCMRILRNIYGSTTAPRGL